MEKHAIEQVSASPYPFWVQTLLIAVIVSIINYLTIYFKEKGKNLATKEDIGEITRKIESVKSSYNESLEAYKNELKKEFESHKYIEDLCHNIDKGLLRLLLTCKNESNSLTFDYPPVLRIDSLPRLANYVRNYSIRYSHIDDVSKILAICLEIEIFEKDEYIDPITGYIELIPHDEEIMQKYSELMPIIDSLLAKFLPKLEN